MSEKEAEERVNVKKGEDDGNDASAEEDRKEKGEEKEQKAPMTMAREIVFDKGIQVATDSDDFDKGPIDLSSLSPI